MSFDLGSVFAHVGLDLKGFKEGVDQAKKDMNGLGDSFKKVGAGIQDFANQATVFTAAATAGIVAFGKSSFDAYNEAQAASAQLLHAVKDVTKATKEEMMATFELSDELERKGVLDGDNLKVGLAQLSTFGLSNKAVRGLGQAMSDLAVNQFGVHATGDQLAQTSNMIAKALNGQFGVLEKSGIRFSDAQIKMIKFGTEMEKVKAINEGFAQNLKYTNDVALTTMEGKLAAINVRWGNFQEAIGGVLSGLAELVITGDTGSLWENLFNLLGDESKTDEIVGFITSLHGVLVSVGTWVSENQALVMTFFQGLAIAIGALMVIGTVNALLILFLNPLFLVGVAITALYVAWQTNFMGIQDITKTVFDFVMMMINTYVIPALQQFNDWLTNVFYPAFNQVWNGMIVPMFTVFVNWFKERWDFITLILKGTWEIISGIVKIGWAYISGIVTAGLQLLSGNWQGAWDTIKKMNKSADEGLRQIFNGIIDFIKGWGSILVREITKPFEDAYNSAKAVADKIKGLLDPNQRHSPSLVDRIKKGVDDMNREFGRLEFGATLTAQAATLSVSNAGASSMINDVNIDLTGATISDANSAQRMGELIGDKIIQKLQLNLKF